MNSYIVLEYPNRGAFSPIKFGTTHAQFIKTAVPGVDKPIWIANGRIYSTSNQEDIKEFNEMSELVTKDAYSFDMHVVPRLVPFEVAAEKPAKKQKSTKPATPKAPALITPPSGGTQ